MPSESGKQHRAMEAAAHGKSDLGIPRSVGQEFAGADKGKSFRDRIDSACARLDSICDRMDGVEMGRRDAAADTGREIESLDRQYDTLVKEFRQAQADLKRSKSSKNVERFNTLSERMDKMADRLRDLRDRHQKEARAEQRSAGNAKLKEQGGKQGSLFDRADSGSATLTRLVEASARMDGIAQRMDVLGVRADAGGDSAQQTFQVTVKSKVTPSGEREVYVKASSAEEAVTKVKATLKGEEKRWASVFT